MPGKSFEEQVREQLADLKMLPDDEVWKQVQASLQKTKKRRWVALSAVLLLFIAIGMLWLLPLRSGNNETVAVVPQLKGTVPADTHKKDTSGESAITAGRQPAVAGPVLSVEIAETYAPGREPDHVYTAAKKVAERKNLPATSVKENEPSAAKTEPEKSSIAEEKRSASANTADEVKLPATAPVSSSPAARNQTETISDTKTDSIQPAAATPVTTDTALPVSVPVTAPATKKKKSSSSWQWGLAAEIGMSGLKNQLSSGGFNPGSAIGPPTPIGPPTQIGPGNGGSAYAQPLQTDALAFSVQLQAAKLIDKKTGFRLSLGYDLYQTNIRAGSKINANLASNSNFTRLGMQDYFYLNTDSFTYRNNYHFIRAGVDLFTTFAAGKRVSIRPEAGAGMGFIISTNGLHYSAADDVLYKNKSLFRKPQWDVAAGLDIGIGKQPAFWFGPHVQYYLTTLSGEENEPGHLFRGSFRLTYIFPRKR